MRASGVLLTPRGWPASRQIRAAVRDVEVNLARQVDSPRVEKPWIFLMDQVASFERRAAGHVPLLRHAVMAM
jgi:hypothetical protein